jgi:hypothetical protein
MSSPVPGRDSGHRYDDEDGVVFKHTFRRVREPFYVRLRGTDGKHHAAGGIEPLMDVHGDADPWADLSAQGRCLQALVNSLKGVSARYLRREYTAAMNRAITHGHLWSPSYFSASCGGAPLAIIRQYIEQQQRPLQPPRQSGPEMRFIPGPKAGAFTQDHR